MQTLEPKRVTESRSVMTEMVMPNDANPMGNLMGGNLLRWMDIASAICAGKHCERHVVTASVDHVSFQRPIKVGDVVTLEATVTRAFNSSLEVYVEVFAADIKGQNARRCNHAYYSFVALDDANGSPISIPPVIPLTEIEQNRFDSAPRRREIRLILSGRMKPEDATDLKDFFKQFPNK
ncbi:MAG TPA: acyl-CoA thioesterase [Haliscomenobacter sp.]|uniref:acyl-CoA thioesterase n=1 Tax=Haliscomenobacter sp. TaxID=2717303 RepID=UPI001D1E4121|nr:acyl-CoA thioesterase [Haliscomenobacter sp.]MBK9490107.1 acyl-CoA thioesterase [Haliscomenobacter sp.]HOY16438.1 acyl-CoA thioesterase [Haliscomenobacter sp.]